MIDDSERREVARRLREHSGARLFTGEDVERLIGIELSGFRPKDADNSFDRLADLIEPSCDRDALLALADEMTVEKDDIWRWSRRIREALGEGES